jgi:hypothetical protein
MRTLPMTIPVSIREEVRAMAHRGVSTEVMISYMRESGLAKPHSIRLLSEAAHLSLADAKKQIHYSPVWKDRRESDEIFHDRIWDATQEFQQTQKAAVSVETPLKTGT